MRTSRYAILLLAARILAAQVTPDAHTRQVLDLWLAGKYEDVYAMWSEQMKKMPLQAYKDQSEKIKALGKIEIGTPEVTKRGKLTVVAIPMKFPSITLEFRVVWDENGKMTGTFFTPAPPPAWKAPAYVNLDQFTARDISVGDNEWTLPGTLNVPRGKSKVAALVLVHGSGPNDRDETVGGVKPFKDLAQGLATRGIAVLQYEKRNKVYPVQCARDPNFTMNQETVEDAVRAAALLRTQAEIDPARVFVLGHSQGGYMMPRIVAADPKLAGVIVLAGNVRPLEELLKEQYEYLGEAPPKSTGLTEVYMADLKNYNPATMAAKQTVPMLILQGERDYQVTMKDFTLWKSALADRKNVAFHSYPKLNHLFVAGEGKSMPVEYMKPGHVDAQVIDDIARWIESGK